MVTADAVVFGPRERLIGFDAAEHPVALQLGGAEPRRLAEAAAHRRRLRLRRDQSQLRLPVRPGAERPLRRLPDARAGAGRRMRRRDGRGGRRAGHRQMPHRRRRAGAGRGALRLRRGGQGRGRGGARRPCPQGLARRPEPQGQPHRSAARLCAGLCAEARPSRLADRPQWRGRRPRRRPKRISPMSTG